MRDVSQEAQLDSDFCKKLNQQIAKLVPSETNIGVEKVQSSKYPQFQIPYGCQLFKAQIGSSKIFFDLGQHNIEPVKIYEIG